jgi:type VI secretion system protein ImpA
VNALSALCDNAAMLRPVRMAPLTRSRQFGRICYRDYAVAMGAMAAPPPSRDAEERLPDASRIEAAFADTDIEQLRATEAGAVGAVAALAALDAALDQAVGAGNGLDLSPLQNLLGEIKDLLERAAARRGGGEGELAAEDAMTSGTPQGSTGKSAAAGGAVCGREDVLLLIDRICRYYADYEPSSPVPLILNRTKRLVTMNFLDIIKDLTPGGVQEFGVIAGIKEDRVE